MDTTKDYSEGVLVYFLRGNKIALGRKTRKIVAGKRVGFGGGAKAREKFRKCAVREVLEEAGVIIDPRRLRLIAVVDFLNHRDDGTVSTGRIAIYVIRSWRGKLKPNPCHGIDDLRWYPQATLPVGEMPDGDPFWLPIALSGRKIYARVPYLPGQKGLAGPVVIEDLPANMLDL
jgi:8-oxo-dGTP diphosphatase